MKSKVLKVKTVGSREEGNLRPEIADHLPHGVNLSVLEYGEGYAIVKLAWSEHPLAEKPKVHEVDAIIGEEVTHPDADKAKTTYYISASNDIKEKKDKPKTIEKNGVEAKFIRKEKLHGEDTYMLDEG